MQTLYRHLPSNCYSGDPLSPEGIIVHFISGKYTTQPGLRFDIDTIHETLCNLNVPGPQRTTLALPEHRADTVRRQHASYHRVGLRDGLQYELLPDQLEAWHAGKSILDGRWWCNNFTLAYALAADEKSGFTDEQYVTLGLQFAAWMDQYGFGFDMVRGHDAVRQAYLEQRPGDTYPKPDPGPLFDWERARFETMKHFQR